MKINNKTRLKYQTSFNRYNILQQTTKDSIREGDIEEEVEEEVIYEDLIQEVRSRDKINLDTYILEIIKDIKRARDVFTR